MTGPHRRDPVEHALAGGYDDLCIAASRFACAGDLDRFSRRYNVNDGFEPLLGVVRHPECDAGTAFFVYWQFHELLDDPEARAATDGAPARWNAHARLADIEERYPQGFRHRNVADDRTALDRTDVARIRTRHPGSPLMDALGMPHDGGSLAGGAPAARRRNDVP